MRHITGKICAREVRIDFKAKKERCSLCLNKNSIEFPILPPGESMDTIIKLTNLDSSPLTCEFILPSSELSGLSLTPAYQILTPGSSSLLKLSYNSKFRDMDPFEYEDFKRSKSSDTSKPLSPLANTKITALIKRKREEDKEKDAETGIGGKKGVPAKKKAPEPKKKAEAPKKEAGKAAAGKKKSKKEEEEEADAQRLEEERIKAEEEDRIKEIIESFDRNGELKKIGGKILEFKDEETRSQHYQWILPFFYKSPDDVGDAQVSKSYLQVRTTCATSMVTLDKNYLHFGEIAVACRKVCGFCGFFYLGFLGFGCCGKE